MPFQSQSPGGTLYALELTCAQVEVPGVRTPPSSRHSVRITVPLLYSGISIFLGAAPTTPPAPTSVPHREQVAGEERTCPLSPHAGCVTPES